MADRDDNYRGYGSPSGRYYENREYGSPQGGDRDRDRTERGGMFGDRDRQENRSYGGRDQDRGGMFGGGRDDNRSYGDRNRGGGDDRGFLERAGEQVRSWFSDDDDRYGRDNDRSRDRYNDRDDQRGQSRYQNQDRDRGYGWGSMMSGGRNRDDDHPQTSRGETRYGGFSDQGGSRVGATSAYGAGSSQNQYGGGRGSHPHDEHYGEWRNQQLDAFDRDYDEYRRENRDKFHNEFSTWRGNRQQQRTSMGKAKEHMEVVGSDGEHVGTVDKVAGDKIILTKNDPNAGGHHHSIPCSWIQSVDDKVTINKSAEDARKQWTDEENRRALFESEDQRRNDGPHILDRSFSGTYGN